MRVRQPATGLIGWVTHRLVANYWFLALCAVVSAPVFFGLCLALDRHGAADWLVANGLSPVASADTAKEVASVVAGIDAAFITLYFSISLIVLTIAAGNLGVRLIDRWLAKRLVRVSIGGLSFSLVFAVIALAAIDADASLEQTPLVTLAVTVLLFGVNVAMLAVALHDLGRTMFVDEAIDRLANDAIAAAPKIVAAMPYVGRWGQTIDAPRDGYVEGVDLEYLARKLADHPGRVRIAVAPGQHILQGQPIALFEQAGVSPKLVKQALPIGPFRSDRQGAVFGIRLLVEIAARALSPAVNDFYTALAAADALSEVIVRHARNWVGDGSVAASADHPRFELCGQDFASLLDDPLNAFRQAAADYPAVSIRMIGNYARVIAVLERDNDAAGAVRFLGEKARALRDHAVDRAQLAQDKADIAVAFDALRSSSDVA
ncbi:DUF2254 family protein [Alteriqipengyuania sp. 357]